MAVDFDGDTLTITLASSATEVDVEVDLYNAWKDWQLTGNLRYPQAFRTVGGDSLTASVDSGAYFFIQNDKGWRIRPPEEDITVLLTGNLAPESSVLPILVPTIGNYRVLIAGLQPVTQNVDSIIDEQATNVEQMLTMIELLRPHHAGTGNKWYWDPYNGDDSNDGTTPSTACKTFAYIHDNLIVDNNHDVVFATPGDPAGETCADEAIIITKNYVLLRGPGRDFCIEPLTNPEDCIHITGNGCEVSGMLLRTSDVGSWNCIHVNGGNFPFIKDIWIDNASDDAIHLENTSYPMIEGGYWQNITGYGLHITNNVNHAWIKPLGIHGATLCAIHIDGTGTYEIKISGDCDLHWNGGYAIEVASNSQMIRVGKDVTMENNALGDILDPYNNIIYEGRVATEFAAQKVWSHATSAAQEADTMGMLMHSTAGLTMENHVEDDISRDGNGNKISSSMYLYDSAANATIHDKTTGLIRKYNVVVDYDGDGRMNLFRVVNNSGS